jgi:prepilin-type processing-associated H-X9-DG protein
MYSDDNEEILPTSSQNRFNPFIPEWSAMTGANREPGAPRIGWLDLPVSSEGNINPNLTVNHSVLALYMGGSAKAMKDPADKSTGSHRHYQNGATVPRVRSMSMNNWMGKGGEWGNSGAGWRVFEKATDIIDPAPSETWLLITEREDSINDGYFVVDMKGYVDGGAPGRSTKIVDYPAHYHNRASALAFADGHAEIHRWLDARTIPAFAKGRELTLNVPSPANRDVLWLQERSTSRISD